MIYSVSYVSRDTLARNLAYGKLHYMVFYNTAIAFLVDIVHFYLLQGQTQATKYETNIWIIYDTSLVSLNATTEFNFYFLQSHI